MVNSKIKDELLLASRAADDDPEAREVIAKIAHPLITQQTSVFCNRYCADNRYKYTCTLTGQKLDAAKERNLCEWGNASYGWMLEDLTKKNRLLAYEGRNGASLVNYFCTIINSKMFYERWKDWRFEGNITIPRYIQGLGKSAGKIFRLLCVGDSISSIAQKLGITEAETDRLAHQILIELTKRGKLHLLSQPKSESMTLPVEAGEEQPHQTDIPGSEHDPEYDDAAEKINQCWSRLTPVEQFILEAMVIDGIDAYSVLEALEAHDLIIDGINREAQKKEQRQQLYAFRRKTLLKLAKCYAAKAIKLK